MKLMGPMGSLPMGSLPMGSLPMGFTQFPIGTGPSHGERGSFPMVRQYPMGHITFPMGRIISHGKCQLFPMGMPLSHEELKKQFDRVLYRYTL